MGLADVGAASRGASVTAGRESLIFASAGRL